MRNPMLIAVFLVAAAVDAQAASLEATSGKVTINAAIASAPVKDLHDGDRVETAGDSKARILLDDGTEINLGPQSELVVSNPRAKGSHFELVSGMMRALVRKSLPSDGSWRLKTNNALMGVRGTEFIVAANRDHARLCTFDGAVEVQIADHPATRKLIGGGQGVLVGSDAVISDVVTMEPKLMDYWRQQTMLDSSGSHRTLLRVLGDDWHWSGPTKVEYLDPNAAFSEFQLINLGGTAWARALKTENTPLGRGANSPDMNLTARLAANVTAVPTRYYLMFAEGVGSVKAGRANPDFTGGRLHQAFVLLRSKSSHSVAVGRQEWDFGNGMIIGRDPWNAFTRSFDGVLATYRAQALRARVFASMLADRKDSPNLEDWMAGTYAELSKVPLQFYGIWVKRGGRNNIATAHDLQTRHAILGERGELSLWGPLFVNEELAYQRGSIGTGGGRNETLSAYLAYLDAGATWKTEKLTGFIKGVFLQASGDDTPASGTYTSFIQLQPDSNRFLGLLNAFPQLRNVRRLGGSFAARYPLWSGHPLTAQVDYSFFDRVETRDVVYPGVRSASDTELGREIDVEIGFEPHSQVFIQAGFGYLWQGNAFAANQPGAHRYFLLTQLRF